MRPALVSLVSLLVLLSLSASAQTTIDAGVFVGQQPYHSFIDDPRVLSGVELLAQRRAVGVHVAGEYADIDDTGAILVTHADVTYRWRLNDHIFVLAGAGPTFVSGLSGGLNTTGNGELELGYHWPRVEIFARARQFSFSIRESRGGGEAGPRGPAAYVGVRFALRRDSSR